MKNKSDLMDRKLWRNIGLDALAVICGTFLFASSVHFFTAPNHIAPGGVSGISTIINYLSGGKWPIGIVNTIINIPLTVIGFIYLGKRFMVKTLASVLLFNFFTDIVLVKLPTYTGNMLVACIFGGLLMGASIGIVMARGGSTGGMDIVSKLIQRRIPHIKMGKIIFSTDILVVTLSMFAYGNVEPGLYALISLYISSIALDKVLYGFNVCKFMYIITNKADELGKRINIEMHRGATIFESYGSFTGEKRPTLMVAVRQSEYYKLKKIVESTDPGAFLIVTSANEIMGEGFESRI